MQLTNEQETILLNTSSKIAIQAYAGSGKTEILNLYAKMHKTVRFLYLCFNKDAQEKANKRFPTNVECRTIDSLCFEIAEALGKTPVTLNVSLIKQECPEISKSTGICYAVLNCLKKFINSPEDVRIQNTTHNPEVAKKAEKIWIAARSKGTRYESLPIHFCMYSLQNKRWTCHEINRKIVQLDGKKTADYFAKRYGSLMIDECQDLNPIMLSIIEGFKGQIIYVGDTHQAIYSFMGNVNAFRVMKKPTAQFALSQSFRFGRAIADHAVKALTKLKDYNDGDFVISGNDKIESALIQRKDIPGSKQVTFLARINRTIFFRAHKLARKGFSVYWKAHREYFEKINALLAIYDLGSEEGSKWSWKRELADEEHDFETLSLMQMIESHGRGIMKEMMELISKNSATREEKADYVLSTVHKAKGLEWDYVLIEDDLGDYFDKARQKKDEDPIRYEEECNIYYVAITRAKIGLIDESGILEDPEGDQKKREASPSSPDSRQGLSKRSKSFTEDSRPPIEMREVTIDF